MRLRASSLSHKVGPGDLGRLPDNHQLFWERCEFRQISLEMIFLPLELEIGMFSELFSSGIAEKFDGQRIP